MVFGYRLDVTRDEAEAIVLDQFNRTVVHTLATLEVRAV